MLTIKIKGKRHTVASLAEASTLYSTMRDASGLGASQWREADVFDASGQKVARVSYNGRVWPPKAWEPGDVPLCSN